MKTDTEIVKLFKKQRNLAKRGLGAQYDNTIACQGFYNADSMQYEDRIQFRDMLGRRRRAMVNFNKVQANVDAVVGFMAQNRRQAKYIARVNADQGQQLYSKNMNALYDYHRENTNADQIETEQDADLVINGYGAIDTDLSYIIGNATTDPNGEIVKYKIDPRILYWDSKDTSKNLANARFIGYFRDYDLVDALDLFQRSKPEDFQPVDDDGLDADSQAGYQYNPWGGLYTKIKALDTVEWASKEENLVRVYNHQWFEYETYYRAENPIYTMQDPVDAEYVLRRMMLLKEEQDLKGYTPNGIDAGDMFDFDPTAEMLVCDEKTKKALAKEFGELFTFTDYKRKCFYTAIISGDHVFSKFKNVCQQGYSIKVKTGQYNYTGKYWIGMVNSMMEPQKYYNKALTELMFTIAANSKGGVMIENGAVEDVAQFESKWAKTDAVIQVNEGAISGGKIQEKARAQLPTGLNDVIQLSDAAIMFAGVDPAFLGDAGAQETGVLYKRRIKQVISKMYWVADAITLYQKEDARLCADLIRVWVQNNEGQWVRITGQEGADQFYIISMDMLAPEYDVSIQEAPQSSEDKQETAAILSQLGDKYIAVQDTDRAGVIYAEAIRLLPLDGEIQNRLIQVLQPQDQQEDPRIAQLQAMVEQLQSQITQAQVEKVKSETALNISKIDESRANTQQKAASTVKTLEDADKVNVETAILAKQKPEANKVTQKQYV